MPELPEVQTVVNDLNEAGLCGSVIESVKAYWHRSIAGSSAAAVCREIQKQQVTRIWRRAKYIVFDLSGGKHLLIHLRMTGRLHLAVGSDPREKHEHVVFSFDDGRDLRLHDTRKFARVRLVPDASGELAGLGPEPLDSGFTLDVLKEIVGARRRMMKPLLLDQAAVAGLGNIYADEALWEAAIHPCRGSATLSGAEVKALHRAIPKVLKKGLQNLGTTLGTGKGNFYSVAKRKGRNRDQLNVFRRTAEPCPRCGTPIERMVVGQRSTHICPKCQRC